MSRLTVVEASRKLVRIWTKNLLFQPFSVHSHKGRESETKTNIHKILERKVDSCVRGERMALQRLYEADARNWDKRNSGIAFHEINQEFESQRFQLHQASRWADQSQRDKISLYGELELRSRIFQEDYAKDCQ